MQSYTRVREYVCGYIQAHTHTHTHVCVYIYTLHNVLREYKQTSNVTTHLYSPSSSIPPWRRHLRVDISQLILCQGKNTPFQFFLSIKLRFHLCVIRMRKTNANDECNQHTPPRGVCYSAVALCAFAFGRMKTFLYNFYVFDFWAHSSFALRTNGIPALFRVQATNVTSQLGVTYSKFQNRRLNVALPPHATFPRLFSICFLVFQLMYLHLRNFRIILSK